MRFFWFLNEEFTCSIYCCRVHTVCKGQCNVQHRWECCLSHRGVYAFIPQHIGNTRSAFLRRFFWCWYHVHTCSIGWEIGELVRFWVLRARRASKKAREGPTANDFANSCKTRYSGAIFLMFVTPQREDEYRANLYDFSIIDWWPLDPSPFAGMKPGKYWMRARTLSFWWVKSERRSSHC